LVFATKNYQKRSNVHLRAGVLRFSVAVAELASRSPLLYLQCVTRKTVVAMQYMERSPGESHCHRGSPLAGPLGQVGICDKVLPKEI
jgi:hypothetical protein